MYAFHITLFVYKIPKDIVAFLVFVHFRSAQGPGHTFVYIGRHKTVCATLAAPIPRMSFPSYKIFNSSVLVLIVCVPPSFQDILIFVVYKISSFSVFNNFVFLDVNFKFDTILSCRAFLDESKSN